MIRDMEKNKKGKNLRKYGKKKKSRLLTSWLKIDNIE